jgi:hypothetical protein
MDEIIAALKPAIATTPAYPGPAVPIQPCASQTDFVFKFGMGVCLVLLDDASHRGAHQQIGEHIGPTRLFHTPFGVYRWQAADSEGYMIALYDAGRTIDVFPDLISPSRRR